MAATRSPVAAGAILAPGAGGSCAGSPSTGARGTVAPLGAVATLGTWPGLRARAVVEPEPRPRGVARTLEAAGPAGSRRTEATGGAPVGILRAAIVTRTLEVTLSLAARAGRTEVALPGTPGAGRTEVALPGTPGAGRTEAPGPGGAAGPVPVPGAVSAPRTRRPVATVAAAPTRPRLPA